MQERYLVTGRRLGKGPNELTMNLLGNAIRVAIRWAVLGLYDVKITDLHNGQIVRTYAPQSSK